MIFLDPVFAVMEDTDWWQLVGSRRYPTQTAMRQLQQTGSQRLKAAMLRTSHLRNMCVHPLGLGVVGSILLNLF